MASEDFKFPDEEDGKSADVEIDVSLESDIEIEIEDDTPASDRGRKPLDKEVEDPSDEEVEQYSDKVQKRIKELAHARHDERRAKESALREREEAMRVAHSLVDENKKLKAYVSNGEQSYVHVLKQQAESQLAMARKQFTEAAESYDSAAMLAAQEALADAKMRVAQVNNFRPTPLQEPEEPVYTQPIQQAPSRLDDKTLRWQAKNQWFGADGYEEVTALALAMHQRLTQENGHEYARTSDYFERIDARLRDKFPEVFGAEERSTNRDAPVRKPPATVVAPGTRSSGVRKIKLTKTQESTARRLGLTPQQYAVEVLKLEASNG